MKKIKRLTILGTFSILVISGCAPENGPTDSAYYNWSNDDTVNSSIITETVSETSPLPELAENSGLSDYLAYAALHNPGLEAAYNRY